MSKQEIVQADCKKCARRTRHEVLSQHYVASDPDEYPDAETWQIIRCLGCYNVGFRYQYDDFVDIEEVDEGVYQHSTTVATFPRTISNHKELDSTFHLPEVIRKVYKQTISACSDEAYILASVGLRATIEATCNHLGISGNSLERRIDLLFKAGHVSNGDKRRLHAIRFLGNDAAHEILEPKRSELIVALEIVEHLLKSVFILEKKAKRLETVVETYDEFLKVLEASVKGQKPEELMAIANILGRKRRLVAQNLGAFEAKLADDLKSDKVGWLKLDRTEKIDGRDIQLYLIPDLGQGDPDIDDDEVLF